MKRAAPAYFLMLLLAFSALNDVCAAATPDTSDDVTAAEDNEYLPCACRPDTGPAGVSDLPSPCLPDTADGAPGTAGARGTPPAPQPDPLAGPPLLYTFMSLRC